MGDWIDVKDAADLLGVSTDTLRKRVKKGQMRGRKIDCHNGYKWQVWVEQADGNKEGNVEIVSRESTNKLESKLENNPLINEGAAPIGRLYENIIEEKEKRLQEQQKHVSIIENLLFDFQGRIKILETDNNDMTRQLKLLPAPADEIGRRIEAAETELEKMKESLNEIVRENIRLKEENSIIADRNSRLEKDIENIAKLEKEKSNLEKAVNEIWRERDILQHQNSEQEAEIRLLREQQENYKRPWWTGFFSIGR